ncbi:MAG: four helix bundle protein [Candidatus Marinimicrobia bacterium]|nr:four helix bundle protein [Candidatus Neomarinimicrobiota bacterium]
MEYEDLPIYKASYDLLLEIFKFTKELKKEYKYTIGESIKKEGMAMMTLLYRANYKANSRKETLQTALEHLEAIRLFTRLVHDLKEISHKRFVEMNSRIENVSRQMSGWQKKA